MKCNILSLPEGLEVLEERMYFARLRMLPETRIIFCLALSPPYSPSRHRVGEGAGRDVQFDLDCGDAQVQQEREGQVQGHVV